MDYIETTPHVSRLHHFRIVSFMGILLVSSSLTAGLWECRLQTNCIRIIFAGQGDQPAHSLWPSWPCACQPHSSCSVLLQIAERR